MKLYYLIWTDFLVGREKNRPDILNWKFQGFVLMTWLNSLNLWTLFALPKLFGFSILLIQIPFMAGTRLNSALAFFIQFALVFCVINYFLIFYIDRYKKMIEKYPYSGGRVLRNYVFITIGSSIFTALVLFVFYSSAGGR